MEPVEIEIKMKQNVAEESDKASKGVAGIGAASDKATRELESQIKQQIVLINKMNKALDDISKKSSMNASANVDVAQVDATIERVQNLRQMLGEARQQLADMRGDTEKLNTVVSGLVQEYQAVEKAIAKMTAQGKSSDSEMSSMKEHQRGIADAIGSIGTESDNVVSKIAGVGLTSKETFEATKRAVKEQAEVVKGLKSDLDNASKAYEKMVPGRQKDQAGAEMEAIHQQYVKAITDQDRLRIKQDEMTVSSRTLTVQMEYLRDKMAKLRVQGKENTEEYTKLKDLYREMAAQAATVRFEGKEESGVQGVVQGVSGLAGALTAGTGVMGLFNGKSAEMEALQARLQSMIAITIGLQEASNLVNKQGAFQTIVVAKVTAAYSAAVTYLNTQLGISTVLSKALIASGIGAIIAAVGLAMVAYSDWNEKQKESNSLMEMQKKLSAESQNSIQEQVTKVQSLERVLRDSNTALSVRQGALTDLKSIMPGYNAMLGTEGRLINDNTGALDIYIEKIKSAAKAKIASENAVKAEQSMTDWMSSLDKDEQTLLVSGDSGMLAPERSFAYNVLSQKREKFQKEIDKWNKVLDNVQRSSIATVETGTKAYWTQVQKNAQATIDSMKDTQKGSKAWKQAVKEYNTASSKLKIYDIKGNTKSAETAAQKAASAEDQLSKMSLDYQSKIEAAKAAAIKKGRDQRLADAKADFDKQKALLEKDIFTIEKLEKETGKPATKQREENTTLGDKVQSQYDTKVTEINTASDKVLNDIFTDVKQNFQGELDRNLSSINTYYDDVILKATQEGATQQQIDDLNLSRNKEIEKAKRNEKLKTIDFEADIEQRRIEISDKFYLFEADRQKEIVNVQKKAAEERLKVLREEYANTPTLELANEIEEASLAVDEFGNKLEDLDTSKLEEIASLAQSLGKLGASLSKTGGAVGVIGDALSGAASSADDIKTAFSKTASTTDKISAGISGLATLYAMVADQIAKNKETQDDWNESLSEAAHRAAMARIELKAYQQENLFGIENPYSKAIAGANQYATAMVEMKKVSKLLEGGKVQTGTKKVVSGSNIATGAGAGAAAGAAVGSIIPVIGTAIGGLLGGLIGAGIGALTKETVPVFESLSSQYDKIYDAKTFELNPEIINDYAKLDDKTKALVDNWDEIKTAAIEAQNQMRENFSDLAGDLGTTLSDQLVNAFTNGDVYSAIDDFKGYISDTIGDIISQMVFAQYFQGMLSDLEAKFNESFAENGDQSIIDDLDWFMTNFPEALSGYNDTMTEWQASMKEKGYDLFSLDSTRTASSQGISTASDESISELAGGVYAMRSALAEIRNMHKSELAALVGMLACLSRIQENTEFCRYLEAVDSNIKEVKTALNDINTRGIKVKV